MFSKNPIDGIAIKTKKYNAIKRLSATTVADTNSPGASNALT